MYRPAHFRVDDPATCHALMQTHDFAVLTTVDSDGVPFATHVQLLLAADEGPGGTLYGHMARANPQWRHFSGRRPAPSPSRAIRAATSSAASITDGTP